MTTEILLLMLSIGYSFVCHDETPTGDSLRNSLSKGDDFAAHETLFISAANDLIEQDKCNAEDFSYNGGWYLAAGSDRRYFIWCRTENKGLARKISDQERKYYLDVVTKRVSSGRFKFKR